MQLLIIQNGRQVQAATTPLDNGAIGNAETLRYMLPMIREDAAYDTRLRQFTESLIADCDRSFECRVGKVFEFARGIRYDNDPVEVERIVDAWTTIQTGWGDCGDKAILMASMLGAIGYLSRLVKVNFYNDLAVHGYDHLFLQVQDPHTGEWQSFDPTPENAPAGWETSAPVKDVEEIWPAHGFGAFSGVLDGLLQQGINTGFNLGGQLLGQAVHGGGNSTAAQQQNAIGKQFDQLDVQVSHVFGQLSGLSSLTVDQYNVAAAAYAQLAQVAQQYGGITYVAGQWAKDGPIYQNLLASYHGKVNTETGGQVNGQVQTVGTATAGISSTMLSSPVVWIALAVGLILWARG